MRVVIPKQVCLTEAQVKEALGLYLDHIFESLPETYIVKTVDMYGLEAVILLQQKDDPCPA